MSLSTGGGQAGQGYPAVLVLSDRGGYVPMIVDRGVCWTVDEKMGQTYVWREQANTLASRDFKQPQLVMATGQANAEIMRGGCPTLTDNHEQPILAGSSTVVRRLTPLECERLQGFPDGWTDLGEWVDSKGKKHKDADSPRYKALGNSIALPFWQCLARRICAQYERPVTLGSLFDGIGGFPLVFERCGAKAVWASEIEEFPIAVTKKHFPELEEA